MKLKPFRHVLIFGTLGSGKTSIAYHLTEPPLTRLVVVDTVREDRYNSAGVVVYDPVHLAELMEGERFRVVFRPQDKEAVRWAFLLGYEKQNCTLLVEEISQYATAGQMCEGMEDVIRFGRHQNCRIVATTQRPADVHKLLVSQSEIYLGKLFETNDARYLRGLSGVTKETIEAATRLPDPALKEGVLTVFYVDPLDNTSKRVLVSI